MTQSASENKSIDQSFGQLINKIIDFRKQISHKVLLIEFENKNLKIAVAGYKDSKVYFANFRKIELPEDALDKSIPTDPIKMGSLIREIMKEERIYTLRASVCFSSQSAFIRIIDIPSKLSMNEAFNYVSDPSSTLQIPIPINKTDFDITETKIKYKGANNTELKKYLLTSIPKKSMSTVLEMLKEADLDIITADIGYTCQLRLIANDINQLKDNEYIVMLELLSEFTQIIISDSSGPISINRITSIRDYPSAEDIKSKPNISNENNKNSNNEKDQYMPLSLLDIKVLAKETLKEIQSVFNNNNLEGKVSIYLSGKNSEHPNLTNLIGNSLNIPTYLVSPVNCLGVDKCSYDPNFLSERSIGRLIGLGLGLMNNNEIISEKAFVNNHYIIDKYIPKEKSTLISNKIPINKKTKSSKIRSLSSNQSTIENNLNSNLDNIETSTGEEKGKVPLPPLDNIETNKL